MQPFAVRRVCVTLDKPDAPADEPLVLLVTDDQGLLAVADRALSGEGFRVATATHAGHALLTCLSGAHIDVLVTESSMQDMTGHELANRVRRFYPNLPVVFLADSETLGGEGVLARPFTRDDLVLQLRSALAAVPA
jgi:CheY-like chemotaxis protein